MVPMVIPAVRPKRGWFAAVACAGSFAAVGGFAAGLYLDGLLTSRALWPRVMMTQASTVATPPSRTAIATPSAPASPVAATQQVAALGLMDAPQDDLAAVDAELATVATAHGKTEEPPLPDPVPPAIAGQALAAAAPVVPAAALVESRGCDGRSCRHATVGTSRCTGGCRGCTACAAGNPVPDGWFRIYPVSADRPNLLRPRRSQRRIPRARRLCRHPNRQSLRPRRWSCRCRLHGLRRRCP